MSMERRTKLTGGMGAIMGGLVVWALVAEHGPSYPDSMKDQVKATMQHGQNFDPRNFYMQTAPKGHRAAATERIKYDYKEGYDPKKPKEHELTPADNVVVNCGLLAAQGAEISPDVREIWEKAQNTSNSVFGHEREEADQAAAKACYDATTHYLANPAVQTIILPQKR